MSVTAFPPAVRSRADRASRLETPRAAGTAGLAFAVLFVLTVLLLRARPASGSSPQEIANFYLHRDEGRVALAGLYVAPFAGIAFLWFIAAVRVTIGGHEDQFFSTVFLGSGFLFVTMLFATAAAAGAQLAAVKFQHELPPAPETVLLSRSLGFAFLYVFAVRAAAVFMLVVSTIARRTGVLPRWLVISGYVIALVSLFTVAYVELLALLFPAWVAAVSIVILVDARRRSHS